MGLHDYKQCILCKKYQIRKERVILSRIYYQQRFGKVEEEIVLCKKCYGKIFNLDDTNT